MVAMAGTGSGSAAGRRVKTMKITVDIDPDVAATTAAIKIDGKAITGKTTDIPAETKQVHVQITPTATTRSTRTSTSRCER